MASVFAFVQNAKKIKNILGKVLTNEKRGGIIVRLSPRGAAQDLEN